MAPLRARWRPRGYHDLLLEYYRYHIPRGSRVLEIGSGTGELLAGLEPALGVGVDFSPEMVRIAREQFPGANLQFVEQAAEELHLEQGPFDYIILSDTVTFLDDVLAVFRKLKPLCHSRTRILTNSFSRLWQPVLRGLELIGLRYPQPMRNWLTKEDVCNLLVLAGFDVVLTDSRILCPARIPLLANVLNRMFAPTPGFRWMSLSNWVVARLPVAMPTETSVSVICPCRNESGNIPEIVRRFPKFSGPAELLFVEGHSDDSTLAECQRVAAENSHLSIRVFQQTGRGKGDAVRLGFAEARHEILMILDADMTVPPEELPGFAKALIDGGAEFVNGSRLVYPLENEAMRFLNLVANKCFAMGFSWLLDQTIKDTLCGTKVLLKQDYERLAKQRSYFGDFDPFGDFDLIFGAAKLGLKLRDYPIHYRARTFGVTQISRFRHGWLLLQMYVFALFKLKWR